MLRVVLFREGCGDGISVARAAPVCDCLKILKGHDRYAVDCGDNCSDRDFCKCCGRIGADQRDMDAVWRSGGLVGSEMEGFAAQPKRRTQSREPLIACAANFLCDGEGEKNAEESVYPEFKQPKKHRGKKACFDGKIGTKHGV